MDIFGRKIAFENENKTSFKTIFGGTLTLMLFCFAALLFYLFGKEMWEKQMPSTFSKDTTEEVVKYDMSDLPVIFSIFDTNLSPLAGGIDIFSIFDIWIEV